MARICNYYPTQVLINSNHTRSELSSKIDPTDSMFNHYFTVTTKPKGLNSRNSITRDMESGLEHTVNSGRTFFKEISKHVAAVGLYTLSLFGTQAAISPTKAHSYSMIELLQFMESRGSFDRYRDPVYLLADEGDELSSRTDVDNPTYRDVVIGWNDDQQHSRESGSYHIYSKNMIETQLVTQDSQWGNFIGSASINTSQFVFRSDGDGGSVQASGNSSPQHGTKPMQDGEYIFTVIYVPTDGDFEVIGSNAHGFTYKTDPNEPLNIPSPQPSPSMTATNVPIATNSPTYTSTPSPTVTNTPTPSPTATETPTPTSTSIPTPTEVPPTATPTQTSTSSPTHTAVPTATPTPTPTATPEPLEAMIEGLVIARDTGETIAGANVYLLEHYTNQNAPFAGETADAVTSATGYFTVNTPQSDQLVHLGVTGDSIHNHVGYAFPPNQERISQDELVMSKNFDMVMYNEKFRPGGQKRFWAEGVTPVIYLNTNNAPPYNEPIPEDGYDVNFVVDRINGRLNQVTKGFSGILLIEKGNHPPSPGTPGYIVIEWNDDIGPGVVASNAVSFDQNGNIEWAGIEFNTKAQRDWEGPWAGLSPDQIYTRDIFKEMAHALGGVGHYQTRGTKQNTVLMPGSTIDDFTPIDEKMFDFFYSTGRNNISSDYEAPGNIHPISPGWKNKSGNEIIQQKNNTAPYRLQAGEK